MIGDRRGFIPPQLKTKQTQPHKVAYEGRSRVGKHDHHYCGKKCNVCSGTHSISLLRHFLCFLYNILSAVSRQKISPIFKMKYKEARSKLLSPKAKIPKVTERFLRCLYYINLLHFHFTGWSSWSRCSNQCGKGHRIRRWECNDDSSGNHCNNSLLAREKEGCNSAELCDIGKDRVWLSCHPTYS